MYILYSSDITEKGHVYEIQVSHPETGDFIILNVPEWEQLQTTCNDKFVYINYRVHGANAVTTGYLFNENPNLTYDKLLYSGSYIKHDSRKSFSLLTKFNSELLYCSSFEIISDKISEKARITDYNLTYSKGIPSKMTLNIELVEQR